MAASWRSRHAAGALLLAALFAAGCSKPPQPWTLKPDDAAVVASGRALYARHCASCHGAHLEGQAQWRLRDAQGRLPAPPHDASGRTARHTDEVLFRIVKQGAAGAAELADYQSDMPAFQGVLSDEQIVAVLSFIEAGWPKEVRRRHDAVNRAQGGTPGSP